jgi:hypothetical protein
MSSWSEGAQNTLIGGRGPDLLVSQASNDTLIAGAGANTLQANGRWDVLIAGGGNDTLSAAGSNDDYAFGRGDGTATVVNGAAGATAATNELDLGAGIADNQLWLLRSGNDLQIDLMGTSSHVTVRGWFASTGSQLQEITAGGLKLDSHVAQLVQAMATYSGNNPGFNPVTATQAPNDATLQTAIAAAWHQ